MRLQTYDPFGRRIKKDAGGTMTWYLYSDEGLIGEYDSAGVEIKTYGYRPNSNWTTDPVFMQQGSQYYFFHSDHLGTPMKMTNVSGAVVWSAAYDAFGKACVDAGSTITNNLRFPGQYYDVETGLHYNYHRFYDPESGRYVTLDPIGFEGEDENIYRYVWNNPTNYFDKDGLAGDGQRRNDNPYAIDPAGWVDPIQIPVPLGHSDFYGSRYLGGDDNMFDFTLEDHGPTSPFRDPERHIRTYEQSSDDAWRALKNCDKDAFQGAMHRLQDYYYHRLKGYRWNPSKGEFGHIQREIIPFVKSADDDANAWNAANNETKRWVDAWRNNCKCPKK